MNVTKLTRYAAVAVFFVGSGFSGAAYAASCQATTDNGGNVLTVNNSSIQVPLSDQTDVTNAVYFRTEAVGGTLSISHLSQSGFDSLGRLYDASGTVLDSNDDPVSGTFTPFGLSGQALQPNQAYCIEVVGVGASGGNSPDGTLSFQFEPAIDRERPECSATRTATGYYNMNPSLSGSHALPTSLYASLGILDNKSRGTVTFSFDNGQNAIELVQISTNAIIPLSAGQPGTVIEPGDYCVYDLRTEAQATEIQTISRFPTYTPESNILTDGRLVFPTNFTVVEGDPIELTWRLDEAIELPLSFFGGVNGGDATVNVDYSDPDGFSTFTIEAGQTSVTYTVPTIQDEILENTEVVLVDISENQQFDINSQVRVEILDDDGTANQAPVFTRSELPSTATVGTNYSYQVNANDPDNDPVTFSLANQPGWMSVESSSGVVSGVPDFAGAFSGIMLSATDSNNNARTISFNVVVSDVETEDPTNTGGESGGSSGGGAFGAGSMLLLISMVLSGMRRRRSCS